MSGKALQRAIDNVNGDVKKILMESGTNFDPNVIIRLQYIALDHTCKVLLKAKEVAVCYGRNKVNLPDIQQAIRLEKAKQKQTPPLVMLADLAEDVNQKPFPKPKPNGFQNLPPQEFCQRFNSTMT